MKRHRWLWIIGVLLGVIILAQFSFFSPIRVWLSHTITIPARLFDGLGTRLVGAGRVLFTINDLAIENNQLRDDSSRLEAELAKLQSVQGENERLRQDLSFKQTRPDLKLEPAKIASFSPLGEYQSIMVDRGTTSGLKEGQAVISAGFLIGRVKAVTNSTAEVALITNRDIAVPVVLASSQTTGILRGGIRGLVVDTIPIDTKVSPGELVVTSALEGLFPAGLAVGKVEEIISRKEEIFISLRISSPVNIGDLSTVFVVISHR